MRHFLKLIISFKRFKLKVVSNVQAIADNELHYNYTVYSMRVQNRPYKKTFLHKSLDQV